jgi:hypothetical protein
MSYHQRPPERRLAISSETEALVSNFGGKSDSEARGRAKDASNDPLARDWSEKPALDKYALRVKRAAAQYRRERASISVVAWREQEARAYAELQAEQQRAMREFVTGEYWRLAAVRDAPHQEPVRTGQASGLV